MNKDETAIVLIEFQNDFTTEGGIFHDAVKTVMDETNMLANTVALVEEARSKGIQVIHIPISFAENYSELTNTPYGILKGIVDNDAFKKTTWGVEIIDVLAPKNGEVVIEGKRGLCGFHSTNLDFILRSKGIKNIAIGGFLTNCCVESTMRTAYENGYNVITLNDCCAGLSLEEHNNAIEKDFPMFSQPMSSVEFMNVVNGKDALVLEGKGYE
ncbi:cysteine hydrolase [Putridiphycobacter roseus]|uniref:Cysteine hydrolase n=1 Tax=Putridiphycobacter roseus TaxID=2219161 RepID=A0A2W1MZT1_9FLAO|nr:cysteine hydrolase [Putridiphycobacter roseus]PZE17437.1 cysteine hydrolase [Putridiphycobacter roseus]